MCVSILVDKTNYLQNLYERLVYLIIGHFKIPMKYLLFKRMSSSRTCLRKLYLICMKINIKQRHGTLLRFKTTLLETVYFVFVDGLAVIFFHVENAATLHIGPRSRNDYLVNSWKNFLENRLFQKGENFRQ